MVILADFRMATFRPPGKDTTKKAKTRKVATRKTAKCWLFCVFLFRHTKVRDIPCLRFQLLFVVSLTGEAKGRHAKTRKKHHSLYDMAQTSHHRILSNKRVACSVFFRTPCIVSSVANSIIAFVYDILCACQIRVEVLSFLFALCCILL